MENMLKFFAIGFLSFLLFTNCSKDDKNILPESSGNIGSAGLISNFELWKVPGNANVVYIDPQHTNDPEKDGTIDHPYSSFDDITWTDNTSYLLKRGTTLRSAMIIVQANGVTIASYGNGDRPLIVCIDATVPGTNKHALVCHWEGINDFTIRDIEITAPDASSCMRFLSNCQNISVINCLFHDSYWGLRSLGNEGLYVYNTEIYNTNDDGMFIQNTSEIEIHNCYVHNVNTNWHPPSTSEKDAGGDGIQLSECEHWHVHHNYIDRSSSGNKFCFISNNANQNDGVLEYNYLIGPKVDGAFTYFHNGSDIVVRYNYMKSPGGSPVYTHGENFLIYGNIFDRASGPVLTSKSSKIFNNTFYKMPLCVEGGQIEVVNNIFDTEPGDYVFHVTTLTGSHNLFTNGKVKDGSISGDPKFADPENGDFHLLEGSDAIDAGTITGMAADMDGIEIPQGSAPDIGALEK